MGWRVASKEGKPCPVCHWLDPADGRTTRWQVSWLTDLRIRPPSRKIQWRVGRMLPVYSCGHSAGITPASLFAGLPAPSEGRYFSELWVMSISWTEMVPDNRSLPVRGDQVHGVELRSERGADGR